MKKIIYALPLIFITQPIFSNERCIDLFGGVTKQALEQIMKDVPAGTAEGSIAAVTLKEKSGKHQVELVTYESTTSEQTLYEIKNKHQVKELLNIFLGLKSQFLGDLFNRARKEVDLFTKSIIPEIKEIRENRDYIESEAEFLERIYNGLTRNDSLVFSPYIPSLLPKTDKGSGFNQITFQNSFIETMVESVANSKRAPNFSKEVQGSRRYYEEIGTDRNYISQAIRDAYVSFGVEIKNDRWMKSSPAAKYKAAKNSDHSAEVAFLRQLTHYIAVESQAETSARRIVNAEGAGNIPKDVSIDAPRSWAKWGNSGHWESLYGQNLKDWIREKNAEDGLYESYLKACEYHRESYAQALENSLPELKRIINGARIEDISLMIRDANFRVDILKLSETIRFISEKIANEQRSISDKIRFRNKNSKLSIPLSKEAVETVMSIYNLEKPAAMEKLVELILEQLPNYEVAGKVQSSRGEFLTKLEQNVPELTESFSTFTVGHPDIVRKPLQTMFDISPLRSNTNVNKDQFALRSLLGGAFGAYEIGQTILRYMEAHGTVELLSESGRKNPWGILWTKGNGEASLYFDRHLVTHEIEVDIVNLIRNHIEMQIKLNTRSGDYVTIKYEVVKDSLEKRAQEINDGQLDRQSALDQLMSAVSVLINE